MTQIHDLVRRAATLRREIVMMAVTILAADALAASECIRLLGRPTLRMALALGCAVVVVIAAIAVGRRLERELLLVRGEAARTLSAQLQD